jgi:hypothetical protein
VPCAGRDAHQHRARHDECTQPQDEPVELDPARAFGEAGESGRETR